MTANTPELVMCNAAVTIRALDSHKKHANNQVTFPSYIHITVKGFFQKI